MSKIKTVTTAEAAQMCGVSVQKLTSFAYAQGYIPLLGERGRRQWPVRDVKRFRKALAK